MIPSLDWALRQDMGRGLIREIGSWRIGIQPDHRFPILAKPGDEIRSQPGKNVVCIQLGSTARSLSPVSGDALQKESPNRAVWAMKTRFRR